MTKKVKLPIIITGSIAAAILIAVIVLCFVTVSPVKPFYDYDSVAILGTDGNRLPDLSDEQQATFDKGLKDTDFSVMHAWMEFVYVFSPKFETVKDDNDKDVKKELTYSEMLSAATTNDTTYLLTFYYDGLRTYTVEKEDVVFDTMIMQVYTTSGEVQRIKLYLYDSTVAGHESPESEDYRITPVLVRANLTKLYTALDQITGKVA